MRKIICILGFCLAMTTFGCAAQTAGDNNSVQYTYSDNSGFKDVVFTDSTYSEDKVTIHYKTSERTNLVNSFKIEKFYDSDFNSLGNSYQVNITGDEIIISGKNANAVSGLVLENNDEIINVRYLDSDKYAVYAEDFACDAGWMKWGGDEERYYTDEEREQQRQEQQRFIEEQREIFSSLEGKWESNDGEVFEFYEKDERYWISGPVFIDYTMDDDIERFIRRDDGTIFVVIEQGECCVDLDVEKFANYIKVRDVSYYKK